MDYDSSSTRERGDYPSCVDGGSGRYRCPGWTLLLNDVVGA